MAPNKLGHLKFGHCQGVSKCLVTEVTGSID